MPATPQARRWSCFAAVPPVAWCPMADGGNASPGHRVQAVDATGAGDCFDGAFAVRMVAGDDPVAAARYANAAAALATTGFGAVAPLPRHTDVMALLGERVPS